MGVALVVKSHGKKTQKGDARTGQQYEVRKFLLDPWRQVELQLPAKSSKPAPITGNIFNHAHARERNGRGRPSDILPPKVPKCV